MDVKYPVTFIKLLISEQILLLLLYCIPISMDGSYKETREGYGSNVRLIKIEHNQEYKVTALVSREVIFFKF